MHLLYLGGAKGGATVGLYQNGGYDEHPQNYSVPSSNRTDMNLDSVPSAHTCFFRQRIYSLNFPMPSF